MIRKYLFNISKHINCLSWQRREKSEIRHFCWFFRFYSSSAFVAMSVNCHWLSYDVACYSSDVFVPILIAVYVGRGLTYEGSLKQGRSEKKTFCLLHKSRSWCDSFRSNGESFPYILSSDNSIELWHAREEWKFFFDCSCKNIPNQTICRCQFRLIYLFSFDVNITFLHQNGSTFSSEVTQSGRREHDEGETAGFIF